MKIFTKEKRSAKLILSIFILIVCMTTGISCREANSSPLSVLKLTHPIQDNYTGVPIYVLNFMSNSISVIDGKTDKIIRTISLPARAMTFSVRPNGTLVVPLTGRPPEDREEVILLSPKDFNITGKLTLGYVPDSGYAGDGRIGVIIHTMLLEGYKFPITLIDFEEKKVMRVFQLPGIVNGVGFRDNIIMVYAGGPSYRGYKTGIYQIDIDKQSLREIVKLTDEQRFRKAIFYKDKLYGLRSANNFIFQNDPYNHTLWVIDIKSKKIEKTVKLSRSPYDLTVVEDRLYVSHYNDANPSEPENKVTIIDLNSYKIVNVLEVGKGPASICYFKELGKVYTANAWGNSISIIDIKTEKLIKTIYTDQQFPMVIRCPRESRATPAPIAGHINRLTKQVQPTMGMGKGRKAY